MIYRQFLQFLCGFITLALLSSCGLVYKQTITQGTLFDPDSVDQLEVGMTKEQVQFLVGYPILDDPFLKDQWKFIHLVQKPNTKPTRWQLTLHFENDLLAKISGDVAQITMYKTQSKKKKQVKQKDSTAQTSAQTSPQTSPQTSQ